MDLLPRVAAADGDAERLGAVDALGLIGRPGEERFDRITRTARRVLGSPVAMLNVVGAHVLWVTSGAGPAGMSVPREQAPCGRVVAAQSPLVVTDLAQDGRFSDLAATGVRAYAGHPLHGPTGHVVGTLCVLDNVARSWSPAEQASLADLAAWAEVELAQTEVVERVGEADRLRGEYASVLEHAGQGILGLDRQGTVTLANAAALRLTGWPDLVGRDLHRTFHPDVDGQPCEQRSCALATAVREGQAFVREDDAVTRADGSAMPVRLSCAPTYSTGRLSGVVLVFDDVTEQQAVDHMKSEFISVVSHELRTPLTSLRGSLGLLASGLFGPLADEVQHLADIAVSSTDRLVRLVDDILDLERLSAGHATLLRRQVDLSELVETAAGEVAGLAKASGVRIVADVEPGTGWLDRDRVVQVLVNLLGNAVTFSPAETVVWLHASRGADRTLVLRVEDQGRGIPPDQLARVFDRFAQVDSSDSRDHGGSGLGLAIARSVVEAHGGTITVTSDVGVGTTFEVMLPQRVGPTATRSVGRRADDDDEPPGTTP